MNGKLDFPCLQILRLKVLTASNAPPIKAVLKLAGFLEKIRPKSPPPSTRPPVTK